MTSHPNLPQVSLMHSGKQYAYHIASSLKHAGMLEAFYTGSPYLSHALIQRLARYPKLSFLQRRFQPGLTGQDVRSWGRFEWPERYAKWKHGSGEIYHQKIYDRDERFDRFMADRIVPKLQSDVLWGFQGSCLHSIYAGKKRGMLTICEQAIAHVDTARKLLNEERNLHPEWADSIGNIDFPADYEARLREEPVVADHVFAASSFTVETLVSAGIDREKIHVLPLGFDGNSIPYQPRRQGPAGRKLKLLYVGRISQRKGLKYLLEAVRSLPANEFELHLFGTKVGEGKGLKPYGNHFIYHGNLPQAELFRRLPEFDAMVFPSIFEGFGMVIVEAMAAGMPVITTRHTGGADFIEHGKNGYLVPIRDIDALATAIEDIRQLSEDAYLQMSENARQTSLSYTWESHSQRISSLIPALIQQQ